MPGLLALLAHPDDELFCAGLLTAVSARGVPVHLAYWTRGEGGGSPRRRALGRFLPRAWHYRVREARRAAAILGAKSVTFLGAVDPVSEDGPRAPEERPEEVARKIGALWERHAPDLLLTHGSDGEYGHPAHRRLHEAARTFAADTGGVALASFAATCPGVAPARFWNRDDLADFVFDSRAFGRKKIEMVRAHRSQRGVFEALADPQAPSLRRLLRAARFEGYRCWEPEARAVLERWTGV